MSKRKRRIHDYSHPKSKSYHRVLLINNEPYETRVALLEEGKLAELIIERNAERGIIGNIYKG